MTQVGRRKGLRKPTPTVAPIVAPGRRIPWMAKVEAVASFVRTLTPEERRALAGLLHELPADE